MIVITTPAGTIDVMAEIDEIGNTLRLTRTHVQSESGANALGVRRLRVIADAAMERMDYDAIEVEGGALTTGAGPGRTPGGLRFIRRTG